MTGVAVHPTVTVAGPFGDVEIDVMLAPVIAALWPLGVRTRQCCQYNELADSAEISFPTASDMTAFVAALFPAGDDQTDELQSRIRDWDVHDPAPRRGQRQLRVLRDGAVADGGEAVLHQQLARSLEEPLPSPQAASGRLASGRVLCRHAQWLELDSCSPTTPATTRAMETSLRVCTDSPSSAMP